LIEDKTEGCHFDTTETIEAELQVVLNTLKEHDFQDAFKKWQKRWERCIRSEGDYFKSDGDQQGPRLVFDQMAASIPEIMDGLS
jgi:hypothetical protein